MRYCILSVLFFIALPVPAHSFSIFKAFNIHNVLKAHTRSCPHKPGVLIRNIVMEGFVLGDKGQFVKLFKPSRNKYLTTADMDAILQQVRDIYEREGYQQLVSISYRVVKHRLVFTVLMTS